jgi:hypothetical protein
MAELFPCLETISLNKTRFPGWEELDKLACLPCLADVRVLGIAFLEVKD